MVRRIRMFGDLEYENKVFHNLACFDDVRWRIKLSVRAALTVDDVMLRLASDPNPRKRRLEPLTQEPIELEEPALQGRFSPRRTSQVSWPNLWPNSRLGVPQGLVLRATPFGKQRANKGVKIQISLSI